MIPPIILLFGTTGIGKSTVAGLFVSRLSYLHISFDRSDLRALPGTKIQHEWGEFRSNNNAIVFRKAIEEHIDLSDKAGVVVIYPSSWKIDIRNITEGEKHGIHTVILFGPKEDNYLVWKEREKNFGKDYSIERWEHDNQSLYNKFSRPEFEPYKEYVFSDRKMKDLIVVQNNIIQRFGL